MSIFYAEVIIERMKNVKDFMKDKELAEYLDVSTQTLSAWKKNNNLPLEVLINFSANNTVTLDWLIFGKEQASSLNVAEKMALTAFNALDDQKKIDALAYMSGLKGQTSQGGSAQGVTQSAGGNVKNMVAGNVVGKTTVFEY